jgi:hypothetical protein
MSDPHGSPNIRDDVSSFRRFPRRFAEDQIADARLPMPDCRCQIADDGVDRGGGNRPGSSGLGAAPLFGWRI